MKHNPHVDKFLSLLSRDENLRRVFDNIIDENIWTVATAIGAERGLSFTRAELEHAITAKLELGEYRLQDPASGPGNCQSDSGCRSPCVYCKSNQTPSLGDIGQKFQNEKVSE